MNDTTATRHSRWEASHAVVAAGGPTYQWRLINPSTTRRRRAGRKLRQAFFFSTDRGCRSSTARATFDDPTGVVQDPAAPPYGQPGPRRSDEPGIHQQRKPLVGELCTTVHRLFVVANHFNSKAATTRCSGTGSRHPEQRGQPQPAGPRYSRASSRRPVSGRGRARRGDRRPQRLRLVAAANDLEAAGLTTLIGRCRRASATATCSTATLRRSITCR